MPVAEHGNSARIRAKPAWHSLRPCARVLPSFPGVLQLGGFTPAVFRDDFPLSLPLVTPEPWGETPSASPGQSRAEQSLARGCGHCQGCAAPSSPSQTPLPPPPLAGKTIPGSRPTPSPAQQRRTSPGQQRSPLPCSGCPRLSPPTMGGMALSSRGPPNRPQSQPWHCWSFISCSPRGSAPKAASGSPEFPAPRAGLPGAPRERNGPGAQPLGPGVLRDPPRLHPGPPAPAGTQQLGFIPKFPQSALPRLPQPGWAPPKPLRAWGLRQQHPKISGFAAAAAIP